MMRLLFASSTMTKLAVALLAGNALLPTIFFEVIEEKFVLTKRHSKRNGILAAVVKGKDIKEI